MSKSSLKNGKLSAGRATIRKQNNSLCSRRQRTNHKPSAQHGSLFCYKEVIAYVYSCIITLQSVFKMGWFDDDDDDDDNDRDSKELEKPLQAFSAAAANNDGGEDEDPLDAFMSNLQSNAAAAAASSDNSNNIKQGRMDWDNEEEATSHWEEANAALNTKTSGDNEDDDLFNNNNDNKNAKQARQALEKTFRKAGEILNKEDLSALELQQQQQQWDPFPKCFWKPAVPSTEKGKQWRKEHQVHIHSSSNSSSSSSKKSKPSTVIMMDPILDFDEIRPVLGPSLRDTIQQQGFSHPTAVQSQTLPLALAGHDVMVTAATGQGKTLAYIWPIAVHLAAAAAAAAAHQQQQPSAAEETIIGPTALVLVPTRELAQQVHKQAKPMLACQHFTSRAVIGGQGKYMLQQELKRTGGKIDLVVATPGRLLDVVSEHNPKKGLSLKRVTLLVLDEADKMLHMGFEAQVHKIVRQIRPDRQTMLLSATMSRRIESVATAWLQPNAVRISVGRTGEASRHVNQHVMVLPNEQAKENFLVELLPALSNVGRALVFVATREKCERLADTVRKALPELMLDTLHGDKHQMDRTSALRAFSRGEIRVLIATDVAGRGLDVPHVATVLCFDPAKNLDTHVHRVGRAGRLSKESENQEIGSAYTLLTPKNADFAHVLRGAFERENREVPAELIELALKSRRSGNVASRSRWNKAGLGYDNRDTSFGESHAPLESKSEFRREQQAPSAPPAKRSRWS